MDFDRAPRGVELDAGAFERATQTRWRPNAKYAWSAGEAMSRFLRELQEGRLVARECRRCGRVLFPPRMFCELCFRPTDAWRRIEDTGTIETFSISYIDQDARRIQEPVFVGVVSLDGASPGMGIMHYFGEIPRDPGQEHGWGIRIGMRVKAVWKPAGERVGSILDIRHFKPLDGSLGGEIGGGA